MAHKIGSNDARELKRLRQNVEHLARLLAERRSDIADILDDMLEGRRPKKRDIEARFVTATVPAGAVTVQYDTLTTLLAFEDARGNWSEPQQEEYTND